MPQTDDGAKNSRLKIEKEKTNKQNNNNKTNKQKKKKKKKKNKKRWAGGMKVSEKICLMDSSTAVLSNSGRAKPNIYGPLRTLSLIVSLCHLSVDAFP